METNPTVNHYLTELVLGNIIDRDSGNARESIQISGKNPAVSIANDPQDIWPGTDEYTGFPTGAAEQMEVLSGSADDDGAASATLTFLNAVALTVASGTVTLLSAVPNTFSTGTVTAATVIAGDTVTVNGLLYTGVAGVKASNEEFSVDTGNNAVATDIADSVNNDVRSGTLGIVSANAVAAIVTFTSDQDGVAGDATTLTSSDGATLAVSGAVFTGGVDADTVTCNSLVYTAVAGVKSNNTEFSIDTSDDAAALDLADSITNDVRVGTLNDTTATSALTVCTIVQTVGGTGGNATTLVSSDGGRLAVSGAVFTGGLEADTITVNGLVYTGVTGVKSDNTEFSVDTSDTATALDAADSITNDSRTGVTAPTVDVYADSAVAVATVTSTIEGTPGTTVDISASTNITASGAFLAGIGTGAHTVKIINLRDGDGIAMDDVEVTINGTSPVSLGTQTYSRGVMDEITLAGSGGANAGLITLRHKTTTANIFSLIPVGDNKAHDGAYSVEVGKQLVVDRVGFHMAVAAGIPGSATVSLRKRNNGGVFVAVKKPDISQAAPYDRNDIFVFPARTDIKLRCDAVTVNLTAPTGDFGGSLIDE